MPDLLPEKPMRLPIRAGHFTRGPWKRGNLRGGFLEVHADDGDDGDDTPICTVHLRRTVSGDMAGAKANLDLITAAPDMYYVLEAVERHWAEGNSGRTPELWGFLRAALRKVRGDGEEAES